MPFLDLYAWPRRALFELFRTYEQPFFDVVAPVDVTDLRAFSRAEGCSFYLSALYLSLCAANATEPFRYRLRGDRVFVYDRIHAGSTVLRDDETFTFGYVDFKRDFAQFHAAARAMQQRLHTGQDAPDPQDDRDDLIHYTALPWVAFTSVTHPRRPIPGDSVPKIVFGKYVEEGGRLRMPVAVAVHHALMDGLHVGRFFERLEAHCRTPETLLGAS